MKNRQTKSLTKNNHQTAVSAVTAPIMPVHKLLLKQYILSSNLNKAQQQLKNTLISKIWLRNQIACVSLNQDISAQEYSNEKA